MNWKSFLMGVVTGLIVGFLLFSILGSRYEVNSSSPQGFFMIKLDKWTGKSWMTRYYEETKGDRSIKIWYWEELKDK